MKLYKHDTRFAIKELKSGWVDVYVKDEFSGEYRVNYKVMNLESAFQVIWSLSGKKRVVKEEDFEEVRVNA
jgi:hypothetical protein